MIRAIHILLLVLFTSLAMAQEPYAWQLTDKDGLPSLEVYNLYQDTRGYMWIATDKGLCRYDGLSVKRYKHPEQKGNAVSRIKEDEKGNIWFKAFSGQLFYIDTADQCQLFPIPKDYGSGAYYSYLFRKNELCLATNRLCRYNFDNDTWSVDTFPEMTSLKSSLNVSELAIDAKENLLFVTLKKGFWSRKNGINKKIANLEDLLIPFPFAGDSIVLAKMDFSNTIYVDHIDSTATLKKAALLPAFQLKNGETPSNKSILSIYTYDHMIWVGTIGGLYGYKRTKKGWKQRYHLLPDKQVSGFVKDKEGNFWLSTLHNGVFIFPSLDIEYYNTKNSSLSNQHLTCIEKDAEDQLLIGGSDGVVMRFDPQTNRLTDRYVGKKRNVISIVFDEKRSQIFFNTYGLQVAKWKESQKVNFIGLSVGGSHKNSIYQDDFLLMGNKTFMAVTNLNGTIGQDSIPANTLSFNYKSSLVLTAPNVAYPYYCHNLFDVNQVTAVWVDKKNPTQFWVGANDSLYYYRNFSRVPILDKEGKNFIVTDLHQTADGVLWCATLNKGLYKIVDNKVVKKYSQKNGLPSDNCIALTTSEDLVWVGTDNGIAKLNVKNERIDVYNHLDGLVSNEIRDLEVVNGKVWAATVKGLIRIDAEVASLNEQQPFIEFTALFINKQAYDFNASNNFSYTEDDLKFTFQTTALKGRKNIHYEYRLLGLDSAWIQLPYSTNFVPFQGLIPGDFTFEVRAVNEDGFVSARPATYSFRIAPPYWQTLWFQLLGYSAFFLIIVLIVFLRYRVYKRERDLEVSMNRMRMQALQSQMNPHFVFNAMSAIQDYWIQEEPKIALMYQARFAKLMRLIFAYSNKLSIHIEDELNFLKVYVSLEQVRFEEKITINFEIEEHLLEKEIYLTPLLIQPQLENCFKHGLLHKEGQGTIEVRLGNHGDYVYCAIQDDGVGRKKAAEYASWRKHFKEKLSSLDITKERLKILNNLFGKNKNKEVLKISDLEAEDGRSLGTLVEMWIPKIVN